MEQEIQAVTTALGQAMTDKGWMLALAESCTGGLTSNLVTDTAGSSAWYAGGVVTYANSAKRDILGVSPSVLDVHGAVSRETVLAMARGVRHIFGTDVGVAISGIAGPGGGTPQKPVGTVWMAWEGPFGMEARGHHFSGSRGVIKATSARTALTTLLALVTGAEAPVQGL